MTAARLNLRPLLRFWVAGFGRLCTYGSLLCWMAPDILFSDAEDPEVLLGFAMFGYGMFLWLSPRWLAQYPPLFGLLLVWALAMVGSAVWRSSERASHPDSWFMLGLHATVITLQCLFVADARRSVKCTSPKPPAT